MRQKQSSFNLHVDATSFYFLVQEEVDKEEVHFGSHRFVCYNTVDMSGFDNQLVCVSLSESTVVHLNMQ